LGKTQDGDQLSKNWVDKRIEKPSKGGLEGDDLEAYKKAKANGDVKTVKAEVSDVVELGDNSKGEIKYKEVTSTGKDSAVGSVELEL